MEATGDQERGNSDDFTGKKKPKLQVIKSRLLGKMKKKENEGVMKQSQSASDIIHKLEDDYDSSQSMLGSRALSHDSIFLSDQCQSDPEPPRVLSQENIHGKIRALQMKLQQQNMHLGPPPLVMPIKRTEDPGGSSEDDGLPHSPPEILGIPKSMPYQTPLLPSVQPVSPQNTSPTLAPVSPSAPASGVDFSSPPQFIPCLDNSAARHRMSVKPRNQRASTKSRRLPTSVSQVGCRPRSESMNHLERPLTESEKEEGAAVTKEMTRARSYSSQIIRPGEVLSAPPVKSPLSASPLTSLVGSGDGFPTPAVSQSEGSISPTSTSLQHPVLEQQAPTREVAPSQKPEAATAAVGTKQGPGSALPTSKKWSPDLSPFSSKLKSSQDSTVSTMSSAEDHPKGQPLSLSTQASAGGVALRPPSLRKNIPPIDDKVVGRTLQQFSTTPPGHEAQLQKESAEWNRPVSSSFRFSVSSSKGHERQRAGSFTGGVAQAGAKREHAPPSVSLISLKTQDHLKSAQVVTAERGSLLFPESQSNERASSTPAVTTKPKDPTPALRERGDSRASETHETGVEATEEEVQEAVEEADEASEDLKGSEVNEEGKEAEEMNAFGVKLRTTSLSLRFRADKAQSELRVKQHSAQTRTLNPAWMVESTAPASDNQKNNNVGPVRRNMTATVSKKSLIPNAEFSSSPPQNTSRDKEITAPIRMEDVSTPGQPSSSLTKGTKLVHSLPKESTPVSLNPTLSTPVSLTPKEVTQVSSVENVSIATAVKQPQENTSELSWMSMAREKTRSLQQLFTSRLPDFASLQTTTRSTNLAATATLTQTSTSQSSAAPTRPMHQLSTAQPSIKQQHTPFTQPLSTQVSVRAENSSQPPGMQSFIRPAEPTTGHSGGVADFTLKQTLSSTNKAQTTQLSSRAGLLPAATSGASSAASSATSHSTIKQTVQSTATYTSTTHYSTHTAKEPLSQPLTQHHSQHQASQSTTQSNLRTAQPTGSTHLSSSPKFTPHQTFQESVSLFTQPRPPTGGEVSSTPISKANWTPVPQGKGPVEGTTQWAGGLKSKALLAERWENRTSDTSQEEDQKSQHHTQSLAAFRAMSGHSKLTESVASSGSMPLDKEDKWQKKTVPSSSSPPSSSPPLQPSGGGQPSWMELAKRKSLAWSDKTMD